MQASVKPFSLGAWILVVLVAAVVLAPIQGKISSIFAGCSACSVDFESEKSESEKDSDSDDPHVAFLGHADFLPLLLESSSELLDNDLRPLSAAPSRLYRPPRA